MRLITHVRRVPTKGDDRQKWIEAIGTHQLYDQAQTQFDLCELHFCSENINRKKTQNKLQKGIVPSVYPSKEKYVSQSQLTQEHQNMVMYIEIYWTHIFCLHLSLSFVTRITRSENVSSIEPKDSCDSVLTQDLEKKRAGDKNDNM